MNRTINQEDKKALKKYSLICFILFCILLFLLTLLIQNAHAYSTEEQLSFNKLFSSANLTESQQITLFTYLEQKEDKVSNETLLILDLEENIDNKFNELKDNISDENILLWQEINILKTNITNLKPENDKLAILKQEEQNIKTFYELKNQDDQDSNTFDWKELLNPKPVATSQSNLTNYYNKGELNEKLNTLEDKIDEKLTTIEESTTIFQNHLNQPEISLVDYPTKNFVIVLGIILIAAAIFSYFKYLKPEFEKNKTLISRISKLEENLKLLEETKKDKN